LDHTNKYNCIQFRVFIGTNPKEKIKSPSALLPSSAVLEDPEKIKQYTELMEVYSN
jgi:hypothetical protein